MPAELTSSISVSSLAQVVLDGLSRSPKQLPPWLFYDEVGSLLFEEITRLPEYYLTRIERSLLHNHARQMITTAADGARLRLVELGAGSADKTRTILAAALDHQGSVQYQPVDVSDTALEAACLRIESELPAVETTPLVADYTANFSIVSELDTHDDGGIDGDEPGLTRNLLLWIGSSIGNFEPWHAEELLQRIGSTMQSGDCLLLGVDLAPCHRGKCVGELLAAYDDEAGVTAQFNMNLLARLNRELGANFDLENFAHCADWNQEASRIEMHLESLRDQRVTIPGPADLGGALDLEVNFASGERLHTENSYKYTPEAAADLLKQAGFPVVETWTDPDGWFAVMLGRKP